MIYSNFFVCNHYGGYFSFRTILFSFCFLSLFFASIMQTPDLRKGWKWQRCNPMHVSKDRKCNGRHSNRKCKRWSNTLLRKLKIEQYMVNIWWWQFINEKWMGFYYDIAVVIGTKKFRKGWVRSDSDRKTLDVINSPLLLGAIGSVTSLLAATICQGNPAMKDRYTYLYGKHILLYIKTIRFLFLIATKFTLPTCLPFTGTWVYSQFWWGPYCFRFSLLCCDF